MGCGASHEAPRPTYVPSSRLSVHAVPPTLRAFESAGVGMHGALAALEAHGALPGNKLDLCRSLGLPSSLREWDRAAILSVAPLPARP